MVEVVEVVRIVSAGFISSSGDSMKQSTGSRISCPGGESLHFREDHLIFSVND